jgi:hypothetical protein
MQARREQLHRANQLYEVAYGFLLSPAVERTRRERDLCEALEAWEERPPG